MLALFLFEGKQYESEWQDEKIADSDCKKWTGGKGKQQPVLFCGSEKDDNVIQNKYTCYILLRKKLPLEAERL